MMIFGRNDVSCWLNELGKKQKTLELIIVRTNNNLDRQSVIPSKVRHLGLFDRPLVKTGITFYSDV